MNDKDKKELTNRLSLAIITLKSIENLTLELLATITIGDGDITGITENILSMLQRSAENFRYIQSTTETHNASRNPC